MYMPFELHVHAVQPTCTSMFSVPAPQAAAAASCRGRECVNLWRQARWLRFSLPFLLVWLPWFVWEVCAAVELSVEYRSGVLCGSAVGAVVGGVLGYVQFRKSVRLASEILELLE